jgi:FKBP-type peptidyl-prolyl cis-trans isomerase
MNRKNITFGLVLLIFTSMITLSSCDKNLAERLEKEELDKIQTYLNNNPDLNFDLKSSGLYYLELQPGQGNVAAAHDTAYFFYEGFYLDGTEFGTNLGTTDTLVYPVGEGLLILGVDEALTYMRVGGRCKIVFPSKLGYGDSGYYMPAYTPLMFNLYLVKLVPGPGKK